MRPIRMRAINCLLARRENFGPANLCSLFLLVYIRYMSRTNVNIDDQACAEVMRRYRLTTKREAINFALRSLAAEPLSIDEARQLRGSGWEGDLDALRTSRTT